MSSEKPHTTTNESAATAPAGHVDEAAGEKLPLKGRALRFWRQSLRPFLVIIIVLFAFRSAVADWNDVPSGSMRPTIIEGDRIFVNKLAYDLKFPFTNWRLAELGAPERWDVIVLFDPHDGVRMVKRVVGLPGDTIELRNNHLFVNGKSASYQPLDPDTINQIPQGEQGAYLYAEEVIGGDGHPVLGTPGLHSRYQSFAPMVIPDGQYFVMGDNRDNSRDSRYYGLIPRANIAGRATRVIFSLDRSRYYLPRFARFLRPLP